MDNESIYRFYMSDSLKAAYNLNMRYADLMICESVKDKQPKETSEEIINRISAKIEGLR